MSRQSLAVKSSGADIGTWPVATTYAVLTYPICLVLATARFTRSKQKILELRHCVGIPANREQRDHFLIATNRTLPPVAPTGSRHTAV